MIKSRNEAIIKKVKGLLAIANDNKNDEESQSAFLLAQKLMIKHDISVSEVENRNEKADIINGQATAYKRLYWWETRLAGIIASNFRVQHYYNNRVLKGEKRRKSCVIFFGFENDVQLAKEMFVLAYDAILLYAERYVDQYYEKNQITNRFNNLTRSIKNSYMKGFLDGLQDKFKEQLSQLKAEHGLMVIKPYEVEKAYEELSKTFGKPRKINIPNISDMIAYQEGHKDGNSIDYTKSTIDDEIF
ncbi:DUF2786 domain-containing protein [Bacillus subtilis]|uniref:DUF2786 domain-containing protein n=1 Tax=Bacillus subtilis group TaxID=653685 RepID=UPI0025CAA18B|nr:DUF2786 domain-containing protein [Bacillus subtilis]GLI90623.1 hypothetical protein ANABIO4_39750 [Bacillus subtilis]